MKILLLFFSVLLLLIGISLPFLAVYLYLAFDLARSADVGPALGIGAAAGFAASIAGAWLCFPAFLNRQ